MTSISHEYFTRVAFHIYRAAGVPEEEAHTVASHQVKANLVGHDSHGIILLPLYVERAESLMKEVKSHEERT